MTCAVSAAVRDGAKAVICASTGNTAASAAAYAARAGITCAVIVPEGKIAQGKMAQTLVHGARVISLKGNFDQALTLVRELTATHPIVLVNSVNDFRIEGQKTVGLRDPRGPRRRPRSALHPGRQRRQHHLLLARLPGDGGGAEAVRLPGRGRRAARRGQDHRAPGNGRQRDPDRQPGALGGRDGRRDRLARRDPGRQRHGDPRAPTGCSPRAKACSASPPRRRRWPGC